MNLTTEQQQELLGNLPEHFKQAVIRFDWKREIIGIGTLQSNSSYTVEGGFQIIKENGVTTLTLDATYSSGDEELPDLVVYLSNQTNTNNGASFISEDIGVQGEHSFIIPQSINPDDYQNVLLFCRMFGARVGFGIINR